MQGVSLELFNVCTYDCIITTADGLKSPFNSLLSPLHFETLPLPNNFVKPQIVADIYQRNDVKKTK